MTNQSNLTPMFGPPGKDHKTRDQELLHNGAGHTFISDSSPNSSPRSADTTAITLSQQFASSTDGQPLALAKRRQAILSVMDDAAHSAGIPRALLGCIWGIESTYGIKRHSRTGCTGDFQFTRNTFADIIRKHGSSIAAQLRGRGQSDLADTVSNYSLSLEHHSVRKDNPDLQALRDNPLVSPYAAAHLLADEAKSIHVNPANKEDWHYIYASYNLGPHAVKDLRGKLADTANSKDHLGAAAAANVHFFRKGATGTEALQYYRDSIEHFARDFTTRVGMADVPTPVMASRISMAPPTVPA